MTLTWCEWFLARRHSRSMLIHNPLWPASVLQLCKSVNTSKLRPWRDGLPHRPVCLSSDTACLAVGSLGTVWQPGHTGQHKMAARVTLGESQQPHSPLFQVEAAQACGSQGVHSMLMLRVGVGKSVAILRRQLPQACQPGQSMSVLSCAWSWLVCVAYRRALDRTTRIA